MGFFNPGAKPARADPAWAIVAGIALDTRITVGQASRAGRGHGGAQNLSGLRLPSRCVNSRAESAEGQRPRRRAY